MRERPTNRVTFNSLRENEWAVRCDIIFGRPNARAKISAVRNYKKEKEKKNFLKDSNQSGNKRISVKFEYNNRWVHTHVVKLG